MFNTNAIWVSSSVEVVEEKFASNERIEIINCAVNLSQVSAIRRELRVVKDPSDPNFSLSFPCITFDLNNGKSLSWFYTNSARDSDHQYITKLLKTKRCPSK